MLCDVLWCFAVCCAAGVRRRPQWPAHACWPNQCLHSKLEKFLTQQQSAMIQLQRTTETSTQCGLWTDTSWVELFVGSCCREAPACLVWGRLGHAGRWSGLFLLLPSLQPCRTCSVPDALLKVLAGVPWFLPSADAVGFSTRGSFRVCGSSLLCVFWSGGSVCFVSQQTVALAARIYLVRTFWVT